MIQNVIRILSSEVVSTLLDPALSHRERDIVSRIIIDARTPYEWDRKPMEIFLDKDMEKKVRDNWESYGI